MVTYLDWFAHLMISPGKQAELLEKVQRKTSRFAMYAARSAFDPETPPIIEPLPQDRRFRNEAWQRWPFNLIHQSFLLNQQLFLAELVPESYASARALAERDTGIDERNFPAACPWTAEAILDEDFWPKAG